jgi:hypothetical protein
MARKKMAVDIQNNLWKRYIVKRKLIWLKIYHFSLTLFANYLHHIFNFCEKVKRDGKMFT